MSSLSMKSRKRQRAAESPAPPAASIRSRFPGEANGVVDPQSDDEQLAQGRADITLERADDMNTLNGRLLSFFRQRLPHLDKNPLSTGSTSTRGNKYYDMHLQEKLRLLKVVFLDGLSTELIALCDEFVSAISAAGKDRLSSFPDFEVPPHDRILDEMSLVEYYEQIYDQISAVASELLFNTNWSSLFEFSARAKDIKSPTYGAADAYLYINSDAHSLLSPQNKADVGLIRKYDLLNFIIWEFKNLGFGPEVFRALQNHEGDFHWTTCQERNERNDASISCPNHNHRVDGRPAVTGRRTGPDAVETLCIIEKLKSKEGGKERPLKRIRLDGETTSLKKVQCILQQFWTSAVVQDATYMVISTGNEECIAIRDRQSQTLYISPPIRPSDATQSYLKICVGLYIAAYKDAANRAHQLESNTLSFTTQAMLRLKIDEQPDLPNLPSSGISARYPVEVEIPPLPSDIVKHLKHSPLIDLRLHQHELATIQFNRNTWTLSRCVAVHGSKTKGVNSSRDFVAILPPASINCDYVFLDLDYLILKASRTYKAYFGIVYERASKVTYFPEPLVLKMSRDNHEEESLRTEYEKYQDLGRKGVTCIAKCYDLFSCTINSQETRSFLLLSYGGEPISKRKNLQGHTKKHQSTYEAALASLHKKHYVHNNITLDHVLLNIPRGEAILISLKHCIAPASSAREASKAKDVVAMNLCLGITNATEEGSPPEALAGASTRKTDRKEVSRRSKRGKTKSLPENPPAAFRVKPSNL